MPPSAGPCEGWPVRLACVRSLVWALLLSGWVGLGSLSQTLASGPLSAFALVAGWLLALGGLNAACAAGRFRGPVRRRLLPCAALLAAGLPYAALHGGGMGALWLAMLAWAALVALASSAVGAGGFPDGRAGARAAPAAAGALLAWLLLGDIGDAQALAGRLMAGASVAGALLPLLLPRCSVSAADSGAAIGDCALPAWPRAAWRRPRQWPLLLASAVMLPMMCGLPLMVDLCREGGLSPQGVVGVHLLAMFAPALLLAACRIEVSRGAPLLCAVLLVAGAVALLWAPGALAAWAAMLAHGSAWSVAWHARKDAPHPIPAAGASTLAGTALVLLLGMATSLAGLQAFGAWHLASGGAAAVALCAMLAAELASRPHKRTKWRRIVQASDLGAP